MWGPLFSLAPARSRYYESSAPDWFPRPPHPVHRYYQRLSSCGSFRTSRVVSARRPQSCFLPASIFIYRRTPSYRLSQGPRAPPQKLGVYIMVGRISKKLLIARKTDRARETRNPGSIHELLVQLSFGDPSDNNKRPSERLITSNSDRTYLKLATGYASCAHCSWGKWHPSPRIPSFKNKRLQSLDQQERDSTPVYS